jgi:threonine synthase
VRLYSTRDETIRASWQQAVLSGIAPDGGLYLPVELPRISSSELAAYRGKSFVQLATGLAEIFIGSEVSPLILSGICEKAFNFPLTLKQLDQQLYVLELFHGPTCAFKDFGARFMAGLFRHFWGKQDTQLTVLAATSGDTGSAVADAFFDSSPKPPIRVAILYPRGKVSDIQRKQMTTLGHNVVAYEVDGTFDDCQALVKQALCDPALLQSTPLTSANSINIARLLPQMFYYAFSTLCFAPEDRPIFSVPSGNLGNLTGGIIAHLLGFHVARLIAACNSNATFPRFVTTGAFTPERSLETISNAMDVGNPSNFFRIAALLSERHKAPVLQDLVSGYSISDTETQGAIKKFYSQYGYILDPHTAVGACALENYRALQPNTHPAIIVGTAHPAKFSSVVQQVLNLSPQVPESLQVVLAKPEQSVKLANSYAELKQHLRL